MSDIREAIELSGYTMSQDEKEIVAMVHDFVMKEVRPTAAEYDRKGELNWDAYNKAFEMGLICADLPAEYGGQGLSAVAGAWIREELMYGDAGFGLTCGTNNLGIKPVLHVDNEGHLINVSKARGRKNSILALVDRMEASAIEPQKQTVFISHGDCLDDAEFLAAEVRKRFGISDITINFVGPVIGAHSGPGTLALFFLGTER